jgi:hypothetical protein
MDDRAAEGMQGKRGERVMDGFSNESSLGERAFGQSFVVVLG